MDIILCITALLLGVLGLLGAVIPIIPGPALSFVALLVNYFSPNPAVDTKWLFIWLVICGVVIVIDYLLPVYIVKRLGGSKSGVWGATIGMLVGFIAFPPLGIILCPLLGAVMGELMNDKSDTSRALKVGAGSFLAFALGTGLKFVTSLFIIGTLLNSLLPLVEGFVDSIF
ncbi:MAG: DUF456 domain-containing protein [Rikenellaceae bacterium]